MLHKLLLHKWVNKISILASIILLPFFSPAQGPDYQQLDGLYFESPDSLEIRDQDFFNLDNAIYVPGREFLFSYTLLKDGESLLCRNDGRGNSKTKEWSFVKAASADSLTIQFMGIRVLKGYGGLDQLFPDYSQTVIQQLYYSSDTALLFDGATGLIENQKNIWLHPFRGKFFSVTEFSPFPYIKFPLKANFHWTWSLSKIDERWSDPRIVEYSGKQSATYEYTLTAKEHIKTALGNLECYVVEGIANTSLGTSRLKSYFHPKYGFVKLRYHNIDKSILEINLVRVR